MRCSPGFRVQVEDVHYEQLLRVQMTDETKITKTSKNLLNNLLATCNVGGYY